MKITIVVHGRFHAFDLAREMIKQGADATLLTNYPKRIAEQFGIPCNRVLNCVTHGVAGRLVQRLGWGKTFEPHLHRWFSRWSARVIKAGPTQDVFHSFSGVSEELMRAFPGSSPVKTLLRGSAHIRLQARLLGEEEQRCGRPLDRPSRWMIDRELREYELADLIFVLSTFAKNSFEEEGVPPEKLRLLPLGSELKRFRPAKDDLERRCQRIEAGEPLRVLTVGSFSYQKGAFDLVEIARQLNGKMKFQMVGDIPDEAGRLSSLANGMIEFIPRRPQFELPQLYCQADVFLFPTIQDGYAVVLAQAQAAGLPILATANCAAPDLVEEGKSGWVLPIRRPEAFVERLRWCHQHRGELAEMVRDTYENFQPRDWSAVAADFIKICSELPEMKRS